ncbi:hypothetical protein [Oerskovia paurometabola]|uniref:hypothetical protein n=1 Tax=Oerskovia paurometabola TaxID=162170 RepID=UPI00343EC392
MSKTIDSVPEFLTPEQYTSLFAACGFEPRDVVELRLAHDGVHALVFARDQAGRKILRPSGAPSGDPCGRGGAMKHRVFVPVRRVPDDERTTRITPVQTAP